MSAIIEDNSQALATAFARPSDGNQAPTSQIGQQFEVVPLGAQKVAVRRDIAGVMEQIKTFAAAGGSDYYYQWTTKNKDGSRGIVEGISIDGALTVARIYGNNDVDTRVEDIGTHWIYYARFTDFETGWRLTRAYQQRKNQNTGMKDAERQQDIVFQIGQSKALRNVIENALRPFCNYALEEAKGAIVEKVGKNLEAYRERVGQKFKEWNIPIDRVTRIVGRPLDKWLAQDVARVIAQIQAVNDGMADPNELWPAPDTEAPRPVESDFKKAEDAKVVEDKKADPAKDEKKPEQTSPTGAAEAKTVVEDDKKKTAGAASTSATAPTQQADPEELEKANPAFTQAEEAVGKFIAGLSDAGVDLADAKKHGRTMVDSLEGLSDDERDVLRGQLSSALLSEEKARGKAKKGAKR